MRAIVLAIGVALAGCATQPPPRDDCERASRIFAGCGVALPVVQTQTCNGIAKVVARCVVMVGSDCDALAALSGHLDECIAQADDDLPPLEDPPIAALDLGDAADLDTAGDLASGTADLATSPADLAAPRWAGLDVSGALALGATRSFQAALDPGTYDFAITGTGDVDLYVRIGHAPTLNLYDCRPFVDGSDESCTLPVAATDIVYVLLRADVVDSTFHLVAKED